MKNISLMIAVALFCFCANSARADLVEEVAEGAKKLGTNLKDGAKEVEEKAKDLGSDIKDKVSEFKDRFSSDASNERTAQRLVSNVEIINPHLLKIDPGCGHGRILDALSNCSKLKK